MWDDHLSRRYFVGTEYRKVYLTVTNPCLLIEIESYYWDIPVLVEISHRYPPFQSVLDKTSTVKKDVTILPILRYIIIPDRLCVTILDLGSLGKDQKETTVMGISCSLYTNYWIKGLDIQTEQQRNRRRRICHLSLLVSGIHLTYSVRIMSSQTAHHPSDITNEVKRRWNRVI